MFRRLSLLASALGVNPRSTYRMIRYLPRFLRDARAYRRQSSRLFPLTLRDVQPIFTNFIGVAGEVRNHYFHQDLWAARLVHRRGPDDHLDVGSRVDGFIAHLLTFMPVTMLDIQPLEDSVEGLRFVQTDATSLDVLEDDSVDSISSLHAIEHFGLGRYGDQISADACFQAMRALQRVLSPGGRLYFSVPIGRQRVEFNAQRIFDPATVLETFSQLSLLSFSAVDDAGFLRPDADPKDFARATYSCGLFEFTKAEQ